MAEEHTGPARSVALCPFDRRHVERARVWVNDRDLCRLLDRARPVSDFEHESWAAGLHQRTDMVFFAIETVPERRHVGNVWLADIDMRHRKAEVRIVVGEPDALGRGMGSEALRQLCDYAFQRLNLHRLFAYVLAINPRAVRAFEKAGFAIEGTLRDDRWSDDRYVDTILLSYIRGT